MTLKEYVTEVENFPFSIENYDLIKESIELDIASKYLDSYNFIQENHLMDDNLICLYMEDSDSNIDDKKKSFMDRLIAFFKRILDAIVKPFLTLYTTIRTFIKNIDFRSKNKKEKVSIEIKKSINVNHGEVNVERNRKAYDIFFDLIKKDNPALFDKISKGKVDVIHKDLDIEDHISDLRANGMSEEQIKFFILCYGVTCGATISIPKIASIISNNISSFTKPFENFSHNKKNFNETFYTTLTKMIRNLIDKIKNDNNQEIYVTLEDLYEIQSNLKDLSALVVDCRDNFELLVYNEKISKTERITECSNAFLEFSKILNELVAKAVKATESISNDMDKAEKWCLNLIKAPFNVDIEEGE